jgi:hypothetical protein
MEKVFSSEIYLVVLMIFLLLCCHLFLAWVKRTIIRDAMVRHRECRIAHVETRLIEVAVPLESTEPIETHATPVESCVAVPLIDD